MTEEAQRQAVVAAALSFLGTPYHTAARIKGAGVDCLTVIAEVGIEADLVAKVDIPFYRPDFHMHRGEERYLAGLSEYMREIIGPPKPGDVAIWKFGRCFSHAAIVVDWPVIVHAVIDVGVILDDAEKNEKLTHIGEKDNSARPLKFFSYWA